MSSTNRKQNKRQVSDYYVTPPSCVKEFLSAWFTDLQQETTDYNPIPERPDRMLWLDPCSGGDKNHGMSYADTLQSELGINPLTIDIRPDSKAEIIADYLTYKLKSKPDIIISNPPFFIAQEFITKALSDITDDGYVIMFLRLNFLGTQIRKQFFDNNMPETIYVHHKRPSFTDDGGTDSIEYAHFIWRKGQKLSESILKII